MMAPLTEPPAKPTPRATPAQLWRQRAVEFFAGYFWLVFKNVVGWILILTSPAVGVLLPGPGGIPMFLIGFALVTFPGKRKLTSRVMSGRGLPIEMQIFSFLTAFFAIIATCILMWFISDNVYNLLSKIDLDPRRKQATYTATLVWLIVTGLFSLGATWLVMRLALKVLNYILRGMPILRRKVRPWLRKKGFNLLPARRKHALIGEEHPQPDAELNEEILEIDPRYQNRLRAAGHLILLWARRAIGVAITLAIFYFILRPIQQRWPDVKDRILSMSRFNFVIAGGMFAAFLFTFRVLVWRKILAEFGNRLPIAPATRIWSTSELARYVPGAILQIIGRIYLARPYGVSAAVSSVSQILELSIFLLANLIVAVTCLGYYGFKQFDGHARGWLIGAWILLPVLLALLHTKVFYGITNYVLTRLGKPKIVQHVGGKTLPMLLSWNIIGLLWQSLALYVLMAEPLQLKIAWLWTLAGAYSLAWCAGFLAFWAPGGLGVRELVFIGVMRLIAPLPIQGADFTAMLAFFSVLTRAWAVAGELILASIAYGLDFRGALGMPDAPGRTIPTPGPQLSAERSTLDRTLPVRN